MLLSPPPPCAPVLAPTGFSGPHVPILVTRGKDQKLCECRTKVKKWLENAE